MKEKKKKEKGKKRRQREKEKSKMKEKCRKVQWFCWDYNTQTCNVYIFHISFWPIQWLIHQKCYRCNSKVFILFHFIFSFFLSVVVVVVVVPFNIFESVDETLCTCRNLFVWIIRPRKKCIWIHFFDQLIWNLFSASCESNDLHHSKIFMKFMHFAAAVSSSNVFPC